MSEDPLYHLKYPIGEYLPPADISKDHIDLWIDQIASLPERVSQLVNGISDTQLDTPYRPGGWTIRQVIHHIPDSHINSYIRFKWALTEDNPTIKAYDEVAWAELYDTKDEPIQVSLDFLKVVHAKLVNVIKTMSEEQLKRTFVHPQSGKITLLDWNIGMYAWHGEHHLGHIASIVKN
jgi:hypothetical protein